jgi:hypothetical protein
MFAGLIPFFFGTLSLIFDHNSWWIIRDIPSGLALYSLAIASFMSGIHWGVAQLSGQPAKLIVHSNLMVVFPWIVFLLIGAGTVFYLSLVWVFLKQYLVDRQLEAAGKFDGSYLADRLIVTISVCVMLGAVAIALAI